jgi:ABC-type transport system involved in multi-copper enzyme maturation permease subunit
MSTTAPNPLPQGTLDISSTSQVSMVNLARVEFRKALDTRAGRWFVIGILALVVVIVVIYSFAAADADKDLQDYIQIPGGVLGYFMPIIIIMLVTSEQSQRNGLVTFTLEPRRSRIVVAKFLAGLALAVVVMVLAFVFAIAGTLLGAATGSSPSWSVDGNLIFNGFILSNLIGVLIGFAISMLIMNTAGAIVAYFVYSLILPIAVSILAALVESFEDVVPWIEFNTAQLPLFEGDFTPSAEEWAQIAVSGTIWLVIPLLLGIWRLLRIEFK